MILNEDFTNLYKRWKKGEKRKEDKFNYKLVDLGLPSGTLWMDRNIGADTLVDYGGYYAWGETEEKKIYDGSTYKFTKVFIFDDNCREQKLENYDDVVYLDTKGECHMPTKKQFMELVMNTDNKWVTDYMNSGVNGRLFKSRINDNSIFIPASGVRYGNVLTRKGYFICIPSASCILDGSCFVLNSDDENGAYLSNGLAQNVIYGYSIRGCKD